MSKMQGTEDIVKKLVSEGYSVSKSYNYFIVSNNYGSVAVTEEPNEKGERWRVNNGFLLRSKEGVIKQVKKIFNTNFKTRKSKILKAIEKAFHTEGIVSSSKECECWTVHITIMNDTIKFKINENIIEDIRISAEILEDIESYIENLKDFRYFYQKEQ